MNRIEKRALVVSSRFPYPPDDGEKLSAYACIQSLNSLGFNTDVLCFSGYDAPRGPDRNVANTFEIEKPPKLRMSNLRTLFLRRSYLFDRYRLTERGREQLRALKDFGPFDLVVVLHAYLASLIDGEDMRQSGRVVISAEVLEGHAFRRKATLRGGILGKLLIREAAAVDRQEVATFARAHRTFFFSPEEAEWYRLQGGRNGVHVPFGLDVERYSVQPRPRNKPFRAVFYGTFSWHPNSDALQYLLAEVWPRVRAVRSDVELVIAGRAIPGWAQKLAGDRVSIIGEVPSISEFVGSADLVIVPVRIGGGTRVKTLEAMAFGRPVISTTASLEGNSARPEEEVLVADTPDQFAEQVDAVLSSAELWERIATAARRYIEAHHDYRDVTAEAFKSVVD